MNIAKVWNNDYPWDVRVEKICKVLVDDGHNVHLVCRNLGKEKIRDEIDGIQIHRLHPFQNNLINNISSIVAFFNPVWIYKIYQVVKQEKIEVILVRDLPLVISALLVGRLFKIPVIFDMAENYPSMWKDHVDKRGLKVFNHIIKNPKIAILMENYVLKKVDRTIVVVEESKIRLIENGVSEDKISIVSNTPDLKQFSETFLIKDEYFTAENLKILYVGYVNGGRGLDTVIKALPMIKEKMTNFLLIIAGDGEYLKELKDLACNLKVEKHIKFIGWVDPKMVPSYIKSCDICIVPHDATDFVNSTIPNKLFDYMTCEKPVIVSNATPLERIVKETKCGLVFKSKDSIDFSEKVIELKDKIARRESLGINGLKAIHQKYNWGHDSQALRMVFHTKLLNR